jgi:hypothetical protein
MHSFVVRLWLEPREIENAAPVWRGVIEHVTTGKRLYMNNLDQIKAFIASYLAETEENTSKCRS